MFTFRYKRKKNDEKGSVSLEHMLFVGAVVAVGAGVLAFYSSVGTYFEEFTPTTELGLGG